MSATKMRQRLAFKDFPSLLIGTWLLLAFASHTWANNIWRRSDVTPQEGHTKNENWRVDSAKPALNYEPEIDSASDLYLKEILKQLIAINKKIDRAMIRVIGSTVKGVDKYENIGKIRYKNFTQANCESLMNTDSPSGVYNFPNDQSIQKSSAWLWNIFEIYCDQSYGGGWTVVQRRNHQFPYRVNFTSKGWDDYAKGFGDLNGEFWLGNEWIHRLTTHFGPYELRLEFEDSPGSGLIVAQYSEFTVGSREDNYRIKIGAHEVKNRTGLSASNDSTSGGTSRSSDLVDVEHSCEMDFRGTWWLPGSCIRANLNSDDYKNTKMMIRQKKHHATNVVNVIEKQ